MIDALVAGTLHGAPQEGVASNGQKYVAATVRCAAGDGGISLYVKAIAFESGAKRLLLSQNDGDSVGLVGVLSIGIWQPSRGEPKPTARLIVSAALTPYDVRRRRASTRTAKGMPP